MPNQVWLVESERINSYVNMCEGWEAYEKLVYENTAKLHAVVLWNFSLDLSIHIN